MSVPLGHSHLVRSPAGLLGPDVIGAQADGGFMDRSPSAQSDASSSQPPHLRRNSTSTSTSGNSLNLEYYYDNASRGSSNSLAIPPSPSSILASSPIGSVPGPLESRSKSRSELPDGSSRLADGPLPPLPTDLSRLTPDLVSDRLEGSRPNSSGSSGRSTYSMEGSQASSSGQPFELDPLDPAQVSHGRGGAMFQPAYAATKGHGNRFDDMRDSVASGSTVRDSRANGEGYVQQRSPVLPNDLASGDGQVVHYTPMSHNGLSPVLDGSQSGTPQETPTLASMARMQQSGQPLPGQRDSLLPALRSITSRSFIPEWASESALQVEDEDEAAHARNRGSSVPLAGFTDSPGGRERGMTRSPRPDVPQRSPARSRQTSPSRPAGPPPRSSLRNQPHTLNSSTSSASASNFDPTTTPPLSQIIQTAVGLPSITHTAASPFPGPIAKEPVSSEPRRPSRSPSRISPASLHDETMQHTPSITDLTAMLGQAIDEIGLMDSRDTPPPSALSPAKNVSGVYPSVGLASAAEVNLTSRDSLASHAQIPSRGTSLPGSHMSPVSTKSSSNVNHRPRRSTLTDSLRKMSSFTSLRSTLSPSVVSHSPVVSAKAWPAAMLTGSIKTMKHPGERALAYARAINELSRADSGLQGWCAASITDFSRTPTMSTSATRVSALGLGAPSTAAYPSVSVPQPNQQHHRNVSTSSEFPMRQDAYSAREISQRILDPTDQPTALPATLPYPQLQQLQAQGIKPSASMQSVSSFSSSGTAGPPGRRGFFSRLGGGKSKESSSALGPPVRSLAIASPVPARMSNDSGRVQPGQAAPSGPRGPRAGATPPLGGLGGLVGTEPRRSLDTSPGQFLAPGTTIGRGSFDSTRSVPGGSKAAMPDVNEADLRTMTDVLPQAQKGVLRAYLARTGDPMRAIGAYVEDEKSGNIRA